MSMTELEARCVDAYARASETTDYGTELNTLGIVRAVLAEAGVAPDLLALAHQYRADLRHPPSADSITRRLAAIDAVIAKVKGE